MLIHIPNYNDLNYFLLEKHWISLKQWFTGLKRGYIQLVKLLLYKLKCSLWERPLTLCSEVVTSVVHFVVSTEKHFINLLVFLSCVCFFRLNFLLIWWPGLYSSMLLVFILFFSWKDSSHFPFSFITKTKVCFLSRADLNVSKLQLTPSKSTSEWIVKWLSVF